MYLAPGVVDRLRAIVVILTTAAVVSAANALNQYLERDIDGFMERTRNRPLPAHRLDARVALGLGVALSAVAVPLLTFAGGLLSGGLALLALTSYVLVYTPLKQRTPLAVFVGAVPGAIPPLIGWTTATRHLDAGGLALFAILFFWQVPHFLAIALYRQDDYARAGFKVFPVVHGEPATLVHIVLWSAAYVAATFAPFWLGISGPIYLALALGLGFLFFGAACRGLWPGVRLGWARQLFFASILHLTLLFTVLVLDVVRR
jgi:protoheme IX farnesyltransferase